MLSFNDMVDYSSELINFYNRHKLENLYLNSIKYIPLSDPTQILEIEIHLINSQDEVQKFRYTITQDGELVYDTSHFFELDRILTEWLKIIKEKKRTKFSKKNVLYDCGGIIRQKN